MSLNFSMPQTFNYIPFLTEPPEDWGQLVKNEPNSPIDLYSYDSSPQSSHGSLGSHSSISQPDYVPFCNETTTNYDIKPDGDLDVLLSFENESFVKVPSQDFAKLVAAEGNPFIYKAELSSTYKHVARPATFYNQVPVGRRQNEWATNPIQQDYFGARAEPPVFFVGTQAPTESSPSPNMKTSKSATPLNRLSPSDKDSSPPQRATKRRIKHNKKYGNILWKFFLDTLMNTEHKNIICWTGRRLAFKVIDRDKLCDLWSKAKPRKENTKITYESITRSIRAYKHHGKEAIVSHAQESNFTYVFNEHCHQDISDEVKLSFNDLLEYAIQNGCDC